MSSNFKIYNASAGSGKTTTLTVEYLRLVLSTTSSDYFKSILAITFTNKAASEMKLRIIEELKNISTNNYSDLAYLVELEISLNLSRDEFVKRASVVLESVLHQYGEFSVSTIDSFTHRLLRTFSKDLNLPSGFEVELDVNKVLADSVDLLIDKYGTDKDLSEIILAFTLENLEDEKTWNIEGSINDFAKVLLSDGSKDNLKQVLKTKPKTIFKIRSFLKQTLVEIENKLESIGQKGFDILDEFNIRVDALSHSKKGVYGLWQKLKGKTFADPNSFVLKFFNDGKLVSAKATTKDKEDIESAFDLLQANFNNYLSLKDQKFAVYHKYKLLYRSIYGLAVLGEVQKGIESIKKNEHKILISDFNKLITDAIGNDSAPFIYERIGVKYKHIFIDEFQDTSLLQVVNFLPLISQSLAEQNQILLVGDTKQSIYRWRNGDAELLASFPNPPSQIKKEAYLSQFEQIQFFKPNRISLNTNYRSDQLIVEFNNALFQRFEQLIEPRFKDLFTDFIQIPGKQNNSGFITLTKLEGKLKTELYDVQLPEILTRIRTCIEQNWNLSDIAILVRANSEAAVLAEYLNDNQIPVVSSEGLLVFKSTKVLLVVQFLNSFYNETNKGKRAQLWYYLKAEELDLVTDILDINIDFQDHFADFDFEYFNKIGFYDKAVFISDYFGFDPNGIFLQSFLNKLFQKCSNPPFGIHQLLKWHETDQDKFAVEADESTEAVKISTIHNSKGLQFPVVILPFMWYKPAIKNYSEWIELNDDSIPLEKALIPMVKTSVEAINMTKVYEKEVQKTLIDNINMVYVASTRAKHEMHLFTNNQKGLIQETINNAVAEFDFGVKKSDNYWEQGSAILNSKTKNMKAPRPPFVPFNRWHDKVSIVGKRSKGIYFSSEQTVKGTIFHEILGRVKFSSEAKIVFDNAILHGEIDDKGHEELLKTIKLMESNSDVARAFSEEATILNEQTILTKELMQYRPDRISILGNEVVLIDCKTGKPNRKHHKQISKYLELLKQMNYGKVEGYLIYTGLNSIVKV